MAITKTTPPKKTSTPRGQEQAVVSTPASASKAASRTSMDRQIRIQEASMERVTSMELEAPRISPELRQSMIRDAAYFRAERRGFVEGDSSRDWMEAEAEIDHLLEQGAARK